MKVYIAGRITGDPRYREKFAEAEAALREVGHIPLNPAVLPEGMEAEDYMRICTAMLDSADAIGLLGDWTDSPGPNWSYTMPTMRERRPWTCGRCWPYGGVRRCGVRRCGRRMWAESPQTPTQP
jgi:hypothetical protein